MLELNYFTLSDTIYEVNFILYTRDDDGEIALIFFSSHVMV